MKLTDPHTCEGCIHSRRERTPDARGFAIPLICARYPKAKFVSDTYQCGEGVWTLEEGHGDSHVWSYCMLIERGYK